MDTLRHSSVNSASTAHSSRDMLAANKTSDAYDLWHQDMQKKGVSASPLEFPWHQSVSEHLGGDLNGRVLEIGCGRGEFAIWLSRSHPALQVVGIDFSHTAVDIARYSARTGNVAIEFEVGDATALRFESGSFDLVISCECIEHVREPYAMALEMARVLKPGGRFCLTTENYCNGMLLAWLKTWLTGSPFDSGSGVQPNENFFLFWIVRRYLRDAGLNVTQMESCHYQWLLLPRVDPARLCTRNFSAAWARRLAFPFGRHVSFFGFKP